MRIAMIDTLKWIMCSIGLHEETETLVPSTPLDNQGYWYLVTYCLECGDRLKVEKIK